MTRLRNDLNTAMTEREFQDGVIALARMFKWRVVHHRAGRSVAGRWSQQIQGDPGSPDLLLLRPPNLLLVELKKEGGKLTPAQRDWLRDIDKVSEATGGLVSGYCWFPRDADEIERVLRDGR